MEYLFYTSEGYTETPSGKPVENLQILGETEGTSLDEAYKKLLKDNHWIIEGNFTEEETKCKILISKEMIESIKSVVEYLWRDEKRRYSETEKFIENPIFPYLQQIRKYFNLNINGE